MPLIRNRVETFTPTYTARGSLLNQSSLSSNAGDFGPFPQSGGGRVLYGPGRNYQYSNPGAPWSPAPQSVGAPNVFTQPEQAMTPIGYFGGKAGFPSAMTNTGDGYQPDYFGELGQIRQNQTGNAQNALNTYSDALGTGLTDYSRTSGGAIDALGTGLAKYNTDYSVSQNALIAADEERRRRLRLAAKGGIIAGARSAIDEGVRTAKAGGRMGSSYGSRLLAGIGAKASIDAENQMSAAERADALAIADQRSRLGATMFDTGRADLSNIYGDRSRLGTDVFNVGQRNLGNIYGEQSRINSNDASQFRSDIGATRLITPQAGMPLLPTEYPYPQPYSFRARQLMSSRLRF